MAAGSRCIVIICILSFIFTSLSQAAPSNQNLLIQYGHELFKRSGNVYVPEPSPASPTSTTAATTTTAIASPTTSQQQNHTWIIPGRSFEVFPIGLIVYSSYVVVGLVAFTSGMVIKVKSRTEYRRQNRAALGAAIGRAGLTRGKSARVDTTRRKQHAYI